MTMTTTLCIVVVYRHHRLCDNRLCIHTAVAFGILSVALITPCLAASIIDAIVVAVDSPDGSCHHRHLANAEGGASALPQPQSQSVLVVLAGSEHAGVVPLAGQPAEVRDHEHRLGPSLEGDESSSVAQPSCQLARSAR